MKTILFFFLFIISLSVLAQKKKITKEKIDNKEEQTKTDFRYRAFQLYQNDYDLSDVQAEIDFGKGLAARILTKYKLVKNESLQRYVSTLGAGISSMIGRPELTFYFGILESNEINAYACPGGYIFITKGALNLMNSEAQLVGVIAHEIAHVNERHVLKKLKIKGKDTSISGGLGALIGGTTASFRVALQAVMDKAMNLLFEEGLQKNEEMQSDEIATKALYSLNYSVTAYKELISKLDDGENQSNAKIVSKTHPNSKMRVSAIEKFISKNIQTNSYLNENRYNNYVSF